MIIKDNNILTDDKFLQPCYRISPFKTKDIAKNKEITASIVINNCLKDYLGNNNLVFTASGRDALFKALSHFNLDEDDVVTILTTTGNLYISSCVTNEIEKICKWSRAIEKKTKVLLVNHEFGFPYEGLTDLLKHGYPIIEDCAHSFASQNEEGSVGKIGDFVIYSLPKIFPIQFGGLLVSNKKFCMNSELSLNEKSYLEKITNFYLPLISEIKSKRRRNYEYLTEKCKEINATPRFKLKKFHCPGVFMFSIKGYDLGHLKKFMQIHGVESSVFYDEDAFFIPVNQSLENADLDYFIFLIESFLDRYQRSD